MNPTEDNKPKDIITGSEALMRALQAEGVKTIFGYPGGAIMPVFDALYDYTQGEKKAFTMCWCATNRVPHMLLRAMPA